MTLALTSDFENLFGNGHSHVEYLCQSSLKSVHYVLAYIMEIASREIADRRRYGRPERRTTRKQASRQLLLAAEAKIRLKCFVTKREGK